VCDGCSSGASSEVGARFAATWLAQRLPSYVRRGEPARAWIDDATTALLGALGAIARSLSPSPGALPRTVHDFLLFAFLAAVVTRDRVVVFGAGDGVVATGPRPVILDPGPENAPRYLAYALLAPDACEAPARASIATVHVDAPADAMRAIVIATDGAAEIEARAEEPLRDGSRPGGLVELACDERYVKNASLLQKRLVVLSENNGRLHDDTSIAVIRRKEAFA
jgi:hypothetical protein